MNIYHVSLVGGGSSFEGAIPNVEGELKKSRKSKGLLKFPHDELTERRGYGSLILGKSKDMNLTIRDFRFH